jgi:hypothetical protein
MQTRNSSPLQAPETPLPPLAGSGPSGKAQWSEADEIALIEYIADHKSEAGDGMKFKSSFWSGAAIEMVSHSALGGVKTSQGCSSKWDRVRTNFISSNLFTDSDKLKKSYNVVATIKANTSGFKWSETKGLNITIKDACAWTEYVAVRTVGTIRVHLYFFTDSELF